ncbi:hypothetical protein TNIN_375031 [Trichonephila inaurata madagascariensis]|uniref:Secreted protein n=1 Tax=Trichonephila inaurata madagascariensis TaxID=2747483 RepID=A0A8X6WRU6_9ARAC|nr:hypothetical protein TNIN_375031 [Trichonephila inaurata madagascariensis]
MKVTNYFFCALDRSLIRSCVCVTLCFLCFLSPCNCWEVCCNCGIQLRLLLLCPEAIYDEYYVGVELSNGVRDASGEENDSCVIKRGWSCRFRLQPVASISC